MNTLYNNILIAFCKKIILATILNIKLFYKKLNIN